MADTVSVTPRQILAKAYRDNGDLGAAGYIEVGHDLTPDTQIALLAIQDALGSTQYRDAREDDATLIKEMRAAVTYQYMPMSVRKLLGRAITAWNTLASTQPAPAFPREEVELIAATLWRNLEDGDQRMARENCACLSFLAKEGRLPSWEELAGAHEAMEAALLKGKQP